MAKLSPKQQAFCEEYMIDLNATKAAERAGYSKKTARSQGSRLLMNVDIQARIEELQQKRAEKVALDAEWVLHRLKDISDRCMTVEPVMEFDPIERTMIHNGEYQFDSTGANRATELIGKHLGMFKDNNNINVNVGVSFADDVPDGE